LIGRIEFLLAILVPLILEGVIILSTRRNNRDTLPPGSYLVETTPSLTEEKAPGTTWSRYGGLLGHWISDLSIFGLVVIYTLSYIFPSVDLYRYISPLIIDLPPMINWIGIAGMWLLYALGASILKYNVNFTPCTQPMKAKYVLATGGPYSYVRHPVYLSESLGTIFALLATGVWINIFGVVSWFALIEQAKAEETSLERRFGKIYTDYMKKTGRFLPKLHTHNSKKTKT
jgi:protein-S-isoprenylcysteine O-methyltransferase Ste14